jgi:hypothetical protein
MPKAIFSVRGYDPFRMLVLAAVIASAYGCSYGGSDSPVSNLEETSAAPVAETSRPQVQAPIANRPALPSGSQPTGSSAAPSTVTSQVSAAPAEQPLIAGRTVTASFTETRVEFPNPERGYAGWAGDIANSLWIVGLQNEVAAGRTLMRAQVLLDQFLTRELSADFLNRLEQGFAAVRNVGGKLILRFKYNSPGQNWSGGLEPDANIDLVERHLAQLAPVLQRNADAIAMVEGGFIGAWGEWHSSASGLTSEANRARVKDALLKSVPIERMVLIRAPGSLQSWYGSPLSALEAFNGTPKSRVGLHNDCFMSGPTDANTYPTTSLRDFAVATAKSTPFGVETCNVGQQLRNSCADILREGRQYSVTYLNWYGYQSAFLPRWTSEGCAAEVARSFGYRFVLTATEHPVEVSRGSSFAFRIAVRNVGWARMYNPRPVRIRFVHRTQGAVIEADAVGADPRRWAPVLPNDAPTESLAQVTIPSGAPAGEYDVWIGMPDASSRLASDARHTVRFANADDASRGQRWDMASARFALGTRILVR